MKVNSADMNTYRLVVLSMILILIMVHSSAHAAETISAGEAEVPQKETAGTLLDVLSGGSASILENIDVEEAKEKALEQAKNEAILKIVGLHVNAEILAKEKNNLIKVFKPKQKEIIDEYKIVSEERGEDGFCRIKINAKIKEDAVLSALMKNLYDDRVIVVTSEKNLGNTIKRHILEHELINRIKDKGYRIVDYRTIKNKTVNGLVSSIRQGNTEAVKKMGIYYLTDYVAVGFVETRFGEKTKDIYSAHATGQVKIHQIGNRKEVLSLTKHNMKGFGSDEEKAGIDAMKKISALMAEEAIKDMPRKYLRKVKMIISEIGNYATYQRVKKMISDMPYVRKVRDGGKDFDIEETSLYIETTKGADYIAAKVSELKCFVIKKTGQSEIHVEARKITAG